MKNTSGFLNKNDIFCAIFNGVMYKKFIWHIDMSKYDTFFKLMTMLPACKNAVQYGSVASLQKYSAEEQEIWHVRIDYKVINSIFSYFSEPLPAVINRSLTTEYQNDKETVNSIK